MTKAIKKVVKKYYDIKLDDETINKKHYGRLLVDFEDDKTIARFLEHNGYQLYCFTIYTKLTPQQEKELHELCNIQLFNKRYDIHHFYRIVKEYIKELSNDIHNN